MVYRLVVKKQIQGDLIELDPQQLHYLLRVLRLKNGDRFVAMNGVGEAWLAQIQDKGANILEAIELNTELSVSLSLITALPKGSGYEQIIRCCTELGASNFVPVISDRTILKPSSNKVQRWRKIAAEAAEQSERQIVPTILEPTKFTSAISEISEANSGSKYICVARKDVPRLWHCLGNLENLGNITQPEIVIATGCEGGWTDLEIDKAIAVGFQPVSLGDRILRAITAPIVASSLVSATIS